MAALLPFSEVLRLDAELVRIARGTSALRLAVGAALDALSSSGGHHELGFSSLEAYARERCERSGRWAADTRALARRLSTLPRIRDALRAGAVGWSTAELLARHVTAETEREWLERAREMTVRELRASLADRNGTKPQGSKERSADADVNREEEGEATRQLTVRATREDGWLFECARKVAEAVVGPMGPDRLLQALLAEGYSTLLDIVPEGAESELYELERWECDAAADSEARAEWREQVGRWRVEAEVSCERRVAPLFTAESRIDGPASAEAPTSGTPEVLDCEIRRLCSELAERDLALGFIAESASKAETWRKLGFASEAQYARERVGASLSSLKARRILARRAIRVPELASAVANGRLGFEAAYLLSRVVTPATASAWIRRAERRTVKHLREEVEAVELLIRTGREREQLPLDDESLMEFFELERCIASGDFFEGRFGDAAVGDGKAERVGNTKAGDVTEVKCIAGQISGGRRAGRRERGFGRVALRWVVNEGTFRFWRGLERLFARLSSRVCLVPMSFLRFLCENFCRIWLPALRQRRLTEAGKKPEYFGVYRRDAFRCTSPVCTRRDVTPHHLHFRSRGGGDEDENVVALCVWCHLDGIHAGRIGAEPPASRIRWKIGRCATLRVEGRTRLAA